MNKRNIKPYLDLRLISIFLYFLSVLYEYVFDFERDINKYRELLLGINKFNLEGGYIELLQTLGSLRYISVYFLYFILSILSIFIIYKILLTLNKYISIPLILILIGNPLTLGWIIIPSKEAFIILSVILISENKKSLSKLANLVKSGLGIALIILIRPWLILLAVLSYVFSNFESANIMKLFKNKLLLFSIVIITYFAFEYVIPNLASYLLRAQTATEDLTFRGARNIFIFEVSNIYLAIFINALPVTFFSITNFGSNKIFYLFLNFLCLFLIKRTVNFGYKYKLQTLIIFLSYVVPYSVTIVNAGNALRVVFTAAICSALVIDYKHKNIYNKI